MYAKLVALVLFLFLFSVPLAISLQINEIMQNPSGSDSDREWVEIYNNDNETYNLTGWKLNTDSVDHSLNVPPANGGQGSMVVAPGGYIVIAQDATAFLNDYATHTGTVIDSSWPDLSNSANKTLWIKNATAVFDNITYYPVSEGKTFCREYGECNATPGRVNMAANVTYNATGNTTGNATNATVSDVVLSVYLGNASVNVTYTSLFQIGIDNKTCSYADNVTVSYNITPYFINSSFTREVVCSNSTNTGIWMPQAAGSYIICGVIVNTTAGDVNATNSAACKTVVVTSAAGCNISVSIAAGSLFSHSQALEYKIILNDTVCAGENSVGVEYWIEDLFGNYAREKVNTTQSFVCSRSVDRQWTPPKLNGSEAYRIIANMSAACDVTEWNNFAEKIIVVKGDKAAAADVLADACFSQAPVTPQPANITKQKLGAEIISYPAGVFADEPFEVVVNISNPLSKKSLSAYSYVYEGTTPVSLGLGDSWKGSWDANKKELELGPNETVMVSLTNKIENGTALGIYNLRVKIKSDREYEITKAINVLKRPELRVSTANGTASVSTDCSECEMLVIGNGFDASAKSFFTINNLSGTFHVFLLNGSRILARHIINLSMPAAQPSEGTIKATTVPVTGFTAKKTSVRHALLLISLFHKVRLF